MTTWKVLLAAVLLALPLGYVVGEAGAGTEEPAPRPALVLPAGGSGGQNANDPPKKAGKTPRPDRSPTRSDDLCEDDADDLDDLADDDRPDDLEDPDDDDGVEVVRPCPDELGEDEDGDDADDRDDGADG